MALPKLPQIPLNIPQGYDPRDIQRAQDQMAIETAPQVSGINTAIQTIQNYLDRDVGAQQKYGELADQKITEIGAQLAQTLQGNVEKTGQIYTEGAQKVGSAYDEASQTLQGLGQGLEQSLQSRAAQLGQEQALKPVSQFDLDPMSRLKAEGDILKGRVTAGKAGAVSNLQTLGAQMKGIAQKAVGDEERNTGQKRRDVATNVLRTIGELQMKSNESTTDLMQKYAALAEVAGPKFRQMLDAAANARTTAEKEAAQQEFKNALDIAQLEVSKMNAQTSRMGAIGGGESSLDTEYKTLRNAKLMGELTPIEGSGGITEAQGAHGLTKWMQQTGKSGHFKGGVRRIIDSALSGAVQGIDTYSSAVAMINDLRDAKNNVLLPDPSGNLKYKANADDVMNAIAVYFNKYGSAKVGKTTI